eukprot:CAMPEP_0113872568 /NCGR_PEP_ID=MMETSP0780_2-20120614/3285_1 /TAXON_ID=652834 /ORGANISM="Palpitomonas bilix" /LENGTH=99 /DNA_ID=CAMNT_0000858113 /DNA_START=149 /DNA_END=448 /DNA_ORIENTATION=+ /assembly_acc=CAM_ASM_000599
MGWKVRTVAEYLEKEKIQPYYRLTNRGSNRTEVADDLSIDIFVEFLREFGFLSAADKVESQQLLPKQVVQRSVDDLEKILALPRDEANDLKAVFRSIWH